VDYDHVNTQLTSLERRVPEYFAKAKRIEQISQNLANTCGDCWSVELQQAFDEEDSVLDTIAQLSLELGILGCSHGWGGMWTKFDCDSAGALVAPLSNLLRGKKPHQDSENLFNKHVSSRIVPAL